MRAPGREPRRDPLLAAATGAPIGTLGGLIGLGGAEFRLPVLVAIFRYATRRAVGLNLAVSLLTVTAAVATRLALGKTFPTGQLLPLVAAMASGGMIGAWLGAAWTTRISEGALERTVGGVLGAIGLLLCAEAFLPWRAMEIDVDGTARLALAGGFGVGIGVVSSLLGVAGGELIIPTLMLGFGVEVKLAGTASLLVSLPTMIVGIARHSRAGAYRDRADLTTTVAPMGLGSVAGAILGAALVPYVSARALKLGLGVILLWSATKVFHERP